MNENFEKIKGRLGEAEVLAQLAEECAELAQAALKLRPMLADEWADVLMSAGVLGIEPNPDACGGKLISWAKAIGIEVGDEGIKGPPGTLGGLIHGAREEHDG